MLNERLKGGVPIGWASSSSLALSGTSPSLPSLPHLKKEKREGVGQVLVAFIRGGKGARYLPAICSYGLAFVGACCLRRAGNRRERLWVLPVFGMDSEWVPGAIDKCPSGNKRKAKCFSSFVLYSPKCLNTLYTRILLIHFLVNLKVGVSFSFIQTEREIEIKTIPQ